MIIYFVALLLFNKSLEASQRKRAFGFVHCPRSHVGQNSIVSQTRLREHNYDWKRYESWQRKFDNLFYFDRTKGHWTNDNPELSV